MATKPVHIAINLIRLDGGTQPRESLSTDVIDAYTEVYRSKSGDMPAVVVFYDGKAHWLADGFHRVAAARAASCKRIRADVRKGSQRDAVLYSLGANATHGQPRTNADKRRAVMRALTDSEWATKSDRWIATQCAVDKTLVLRMRKEQVVLNTTRKPAEKRIGRDGKQQAATKRKPAAASGNVTPIRPDARQVELPTTVRVHVEPQPDRPVMSVTVKTSRPPADAPDPRQLSLVTPTPPVAGSPKASKPPPLPLSGILRELAGYSDAIGSTFMRIAVDEMPQASIEQRKKLFDALDEHERLTQQLRARLKKDAAAVSGVEADRQKEMTHA